MTTLSNNIKDILSRGSSVIVDANDYLPNDLKDFASWANKKSGHLTIKNASKLLPQTMKDIADWGKLNVTLDFSDQS